MNNNLTYWNKLKQPPDNVLSKIKAGRLKGMTDIKPIWRIQAMTELFGPCGIGWKYEVTKRWTEQGSDGQIFAFVDINLFIKDEIAVFGTDDKWSEAIPGNGGSMLIAKEKYGMHCSDEAFKMATTDALSSAMKMIGVAADVYMGGYDGSKYNIPDQPKPRALMTKKQSDSLIDFCKKENLEPKEIASKYGITKHMTEIQFDNVFGQLKIDVEAGDIGFRFAIPDGDGEGSH